MFFKRTIHYAPAALLLTGLLSLAVACNYDKDYEINDLSKIDTSVTVFQDGIRVPIGSSNEIAVGDLINEAGEGLGDILKKSEDGSLYLTIGPESISLDDRIKELNLSEMASIKGESFSKEFSHHIGNFDTENFSIDAQLYNLKVNFEGVETLDVKTKPITVSADGLSFHAGLDAYKNVIKDNKDLDLASKIDAIVYTHPVAERAKIDEKAAVCPTENVPIPAEVLGEVELPNNPGQLHVDPIILDEKVTKVSNIQTSPNAKLWVKLALSNVCLTDGEVVPDVNLDFDGLLIIAGGNVINVKDMVLNSGNNWQATKSFDIMGLYKTEYDGAFTLDDEIPVTGKVTVNNPATTKTKLAATSGDIILDIELYFSDFVIQSADLAIETEPFEQAQKLTFGDFEDTTLPDEISDVKSISFDESKPLTLKITPKNLGILKSMNLPYAFVIAFPDNFKVKDAVNGRLEFSGDLADGAVTKDIVIQEIKPTVNGRKVSLDAEVNVSATVEPKNIVINSAKLPATPDGDLSFTVSVDWTPVISDYLIQLKDYEEIIEEGDMSGEIKFEADDLGDFGSFHIIPEGTPALSIKLDIPTIKGLKLTPGQNGLKLVLPDVLVFDQAGIDQALNFNAADNSITLTNSFPTSISLPIKELFVKPEKVGGKIMVVSSYSAVGNVSIPGTEISQDELKEAFGKDVGLEVSLPAIEVKSINMDDDLSFDIDKQTFTIKVSNLPEELTRIDEIVLDNVYLSFEANFDGLPQSGNVPFVVDLNVTAPEFIQPSELKFHGTIDNGVLNLPPVKLDKIVNIVPDEEGKLTGKLEISGSVSASGASIDLKTLKPDITATFTGKIENPETGRIAISRASGVFTYEVSESTTVVLDQLPDMLKDENIRLDLKEAPLTLDIRSNIGIPLNASLKIVPFRNDVPMKDNIINLENVAMPYSTSIDNEDVKRLTVDVASLIKEVPDSLQIHIDAVVDNTRTSLVEIVPGKDYTVNIDYGIYVPLAFGADFRFSTETELDLSSASSITSYGEFGLEGKVRNDTPLKLTLEVRLLDGEGVTIPQKGEDSKPVEFKEIPVDGAATSDVAFTLSSADRTREIKKAKVKVSVTAVPDKTIKATDCLQILDVVVVAPEGITIKP